MCEYRHCAETSCLRLHSFLGHQQLPQCHTVQSCVRHPAQFTSLYQFKDKLQTRQFLHCLHNRRNLGSKILGWRSWLLPHFNLSRPSGYFMYHQVIFYPQSVLMCCVWRQITALQSSSWLRFAIRPIIFTTRYELNFQQYFRLTQVLKALNICLFRD